MFPISHKPKAVEIFKDKASKSLKTVFWHTGFLMTCMKWESFTKKAWPLISSFCCFSVTFRAFYGLSLL